MADSAVQGDILHASCVCHNGKGLLILGPSGAGKSTLAMQMIALGAQLVSDDRCMVTPHAGQLIARPPVSIAGLIEARGLGILRLPYAPHAPIAAVVDLGQSENPARLPAPRSLQIAGIDLDFLHFQTGAHFPSLLMCYLIGQRSE